MFAGPEERAIVPQIKTMFPAKTIVFDRLTLGQLVSAQARLTLFISNDTGPVHVAAAVGTPEIVVFDRPDPHSYTPVGEQHRIIFSPSVHQISVADVYRTAHELLAISRTDRLLLRDVL